MGISGITSTTGNMSAMQMSSANVKDYKTKNIQNEITEVQQQIQKLSSEDELSANEKADAKKELQKEKSSLDTELKQHQDTLLRSQKREIRLAELQEEQKPAGEDEEETEDRVQAKEASSVTVNEENRTADERQALQPGTVIAQNDDGTVILKEVLNQAENTSEDKESTPIGEAQKAAAVEEEKQADEEDADPALSDQQMQAMVKADTSMQQADRMGTLVTKTEDGIAVLKGEIKQDAYRGVDTERKQAELNDMQKQREREMGVQFALLGEASHIMKTDDDTESVKDRTGQDAGMNFQVSGLNTPQDEQAAQERFHVAIA